MFKKRLTCAIVYFCLFCTSLILPSSFATLSAQEHRALALKIKSKLKFGIAFKVPKNKKAGFAKLNYCALVKKSWIATLSVKKSGSYTTAPGNQSAQNKICKTLGKAFVKAGITYKKTTASSSPAISSSASSFVRIIGSAEEYPITYGIGTASAETVFELPSNYSIIEIASPPQIVAGTSCYYAFISPTGSISCLSGVKGISGASVLSVKTARAFQSDADKSVYFVGTKELGIASKELFRLTASGALNTVYSTPSLGTISGYLTLSNGDILISLELANTENISDPSYDKAPVLKLLSGGVETTLSSDTRAISGNSLGWISEFADGRAYTGLSNYSGSTSGLASTAQLHRLTEGLDGLELYLTPSSEPICSGITTGPLCAYGASIVRSSVSTPSATYLVAQEPLLSFPFSLSSSLIKVYPALDTVSLTSLVNPSGMAGYGSTLLIAGKTAAGQGTLVSYNTDLNTETVIKTGILIGDGPYFVKRSSSFIAYGTDFSNMPPTLVAIEVPISSTGTLGAARLSSIALGSTINIAF